MKYNIITLTILSLMYIKQYNSLPQVGNSEINPISNIDLLSKKDNPNNTLATEKQNVFLLQIQRSNQINLIKKIIKIKENNNKDNDPTNLINNPRK